MADRKDWLALKDRRASERRDETLQVILRAAVNAQTLTGSPQWDEYLSYLQAAVEQTEKQRAEFAARLVSDSVLSHDELMRLKLAVARCDERVMAWNTAMQLPNDLKAAGIQAKSVLDRMEKVVA